MKAIVAVDEKWGIGKRNGLLFELPLDMKFFRETTTGKIIVMGSNTLLSFPNGKPLKNRTNIVLFPGGQRDDCIVAQSLPELLEILKNYPTDDTFIVGGAMFYRTMLPYCDTVYVTKVAADGGAEVFYENLDDMPDEWKCAKVGEPLETNGYTIRFCTYERIK